MNKKHLAIVIIAITWFSDATCMRRPNTSSSKSHSLPREKPLKEILFDAIEKTKLFSCFYLKGNSTSDSLRDICSRTALSNPRELCNKLVEDIEFILKMEIELSSLIPRITPEELEFSRTMLYSLIETVGRREPDSSYKQQMRQDFLTTALKLYKKLQHIIAQEQHSKLHSETLSPGYIMVIRQIIATLELIFDGLMVDYRSTE